jgi:hypothetical protein
VHVDIDSELQVLVEFNCCGRVKNNADVGNERLSVDQRKAQARNGTVSRYGDNFMAKFRHGFAKLIKELKWELCKWTLNFKIPPHIQKRFHYRIVKQLLNSRVYVFALFLSDQQVNIFDLGAGAQQLIDENFSHKTLTTVTLTATTKKEFNKLLNIAPHECACTHTLARCSPHLTVSSKQASNVQRLQYANIYCVIICRETLVSTFPSPSKVQAAERSSEAR